MRILVIVPTYNEAENIKPFTKAVLEKVSNEVEILIVDDGSPDGTGTIADSLSKEEPRIHVLHRKGKLGLASAYIQGFSWGIERGFEAFVEMDADFSHDPKYLPTMINLIKQNDVVIGSRYVDGGGTVNWGLGRKIISQGGSFYARSVLGIPIRDLTGGFNGWKKHVLEKIDIKSIHSEGYSFQIELKYRAFRHGFRPKEFPIIFEDRRVGASKMNKKIVLEALWRVWKFRNFSI